MGKLVSLFSIRDDQSIQMARASDLELGLRIALTDLYQLGIGATSLLQKITNICNLLRHDIYCE